jgi:hypothetical protein
MTKIQKKILKQSGLTLIETVVSLGIFTLIVYGIVGLVGAIVTSSGQQGNLLADMDEARKASEKITQELRNGQVGNKGNHVLESCGDQEIIFYSNIDEDVNVERVRYFVENGKLKKGIIEYNGSEYLVANEETSIVLNNLANNSDPVFNYYDDTYLGLSSQLPLIQPVTALNVRFVVANFKIANNAGYGNQNMYTVSSSATLRILKTNLGS